MVQLDISNRILSIALRVDVGDNYINFCNKQGLCENCELTPFFQESLSKHNFEQPCESIYELIKAVQTLYNNQHSKNL